MVEKQPKSTPDMLNPPHPTARRGYITYPHGHSLWLQRPLANFAKIQSSRKQRFNKRLLYVLALLRRQATAAFSARGEARGILVKISIVIREVCTNLFDNIRVVLNS